MNELKAAVTYHSLHTMFYLTLVKIINYVNTTLRHDYYKQLIVSHRYPYSRPFWARYYGCVFYRTNKLNYIWEILSLCYTSPSSLRNLRWKSYTTLIQWECILFFDVTHCRNQFQSGMPNPNFQNQEIFYEISKVIKLNSNGLTQVLTCLINGNTPIHFATE